MATRKRLVLFCAAVFAAVALKSSSASAGLCGFCGGNAATVEDGVLFDELNVKKGVHRPGKPWIEQATLGNDPVTLEVTGDHLVAIDPKGKPGRIEGQGLAGLLMIVKKDKEYGVRLIEVVPRQFWVGANGPPLPSYLFRVWTCDPTDPGCMGQKEKELETTMARPVCSTHPQAEAVAMGLGEEYKYATTFAGDHFTSDHSMTKETEPGWFNLACFGTAAAKMHLLRHTEAGSIAGFTTTLDQRTAMLRAITADYLSNGKSWTGDGTPLYWTDKRQWFPLQVQGYPTQMAEPRPKGGGTSSVANSVRRELLEEERVEAAWGDRGRLLCLNEPRRTPHAVDGNCTAPAVVRADVTQARQKKHLSMVPECDALVGMSKAMNPWAANGRFAKAYVITVNHAKKADYCNK